MITNFLKLGYLISGLLSHNYPFLKPFSKALNHNHWKEKRSLPESDACANCGACMAVCPSYLMNRTEAVAAKGKLFLLKQLVKGSPLPEVLAEKVFLCLHCHLCEYVCQSKLTLVPVWEKLELALEKTLGRPKEKIEDFVKQVEANPAYGELLDSFNIVSDNNYR
jgi:Fe-S oxidoreductase